MIYIRRLLSVGDENQSPRDVSWVALIIITNLRALHITINYKRERSARIERYTKYPTNAVLGICTQTFWVLGKFRLNVPHSKWRFSENSLTRAQVEHVAVHSEHGGVALVVTFPGASHRVNRARRRGHRTLSVVDGSQECDARGRVRQRDQPVKVRGLFASGGEQSALDRGHPAAGFRVAPRLQPPELDQGGLHARLFQRSQSRLKTTRRVGQNDRRESS